MTTISVAGLKEAADLIRAISLRMPTGVITDLADVAFNTMRAGAGRHSPRPMGTGALFRSLFRDGDGTLKQAVGHDLDSAPHAVFVVFPTRAHEIKPKKPGGWLAWRSRFGGPMVFRRRVWHPGYEGDNYRDDALDASLGQFAAIVSNNLKGL